MPEALVAARYNVTTRTTTPWDQDPDLGFPEAMRVNGRKYRNVTQLQDWERRRAASGERPGSKKEDDVPVLSTVLTDCLREAGATTDEIDTLLKDLPERFRQQSDVAEPRQPRPTHLHKSRPIEPRAE
jgi:hypothetical protein